MPKLTLRHLLIAAVFLLTALVVMLPQSFDPDLYWHIRSGEIMLDTGKVITGDLFSHTLPGVLRPHHEWLTEVILAGLYRAFGDYGITLVAVVFSMSALTLMYRLSKGGLAVRLVMVLLVANITTTTAMARPQGWMLNFILILVGIVLGRHKKALPWIPVMMLAWVNLHGGWITGYLVLGAGIVSEAARVFFRRGGDVVWLRRLTLWSLAGVLVLLVNPYGFDQLLVPLDTFTQAARPYISEWLPPNLLAFNRLSYSFVLVLTVLIALKYYRRISLVEAFLLGGFGLWSLMTARVVLLYTFVAPVILIPYLSEWLADIAPRLTLRDDVLRRPARLGLLVVGALALLVGLLFINGSRPDRIRLIQEVSYPANAVDFLRQSGAPRELFNTDNWGGYLIYTLPEYPVFIDTRADLYDDFFLVYLSILRAEDGWEDKLAQYDVQTVLVGIQRPLTAVIRADPDWRIIYEDEIAVIFQKVTGG